MVKRQKKSAKSTVVELTSEERIKRLKNLKTGDKYAYKNVGFGETTYETISDDKVRHKNGRLFTNVFESRGMEWTGETWKFDSGLGLVTTIVLLEDVPKGGLK